MSGSYLSRGCPEGGPVLRWPSVSGQASTSRRDDDSKCDRTQQSPPIRSKNLTRTENRGHKPQHAAKLERDPVRPLHKAS